TGTSELLRELGVAVQLGLLAWVGFPFLAFFSTDAIKVVSRLVHRSPTRTAGHSRRCARVDSIGAERFRELLSPYLKIRLAWIQARSIPSEHLYAQVDVR